MPHHSPSPPIFGRRQIVRGSLWTLIGYGGSQVLRLGSNLILARLLFPEAFGLMALVNVFMQGLQMFSDIGLSSAAVQHRRGNDPVFLHTAWSIQILRGIMLWLGACALALPAARFFAANDPGAAQLAVMLPVAGITALIAGFSSTGIFLMVRNIATARLTLMELISQVASVTVMVLWAWHSPTVWALIAGGIVFSTVRMGLSHVWNPGVRDRLGWNAEARRDLFRFGKWIFLSTLVTFLASHLDRLMLGKLLSMAELGLYSIGMTFARVAIHTSSRLSHAVIFPLLSRLQDDPPRLVQACLQARAPVLWLSGALCCGLALMAPLFFETLYDPRYADAGLISRWLALYTWTHVLVSSMDRIPLALGNPRVLFGANLLSTCGMAVALPGYFWMGLPGFILGMSAANLLAYLYLTAALPTGGLRMSLQSLGFSLGLLGYTLPVMAGLETIQKQVTPILQILLLGLAGGLPVLVGLWQIRKRVRQMK